MNRTSSTDVWNDCLDIIKAEINPKSFKTWFKPIKAIKISEDVLTIEVPNKFFYEWLEEHHLPIIKKAIQKSLGPTARLEYTYYLNKDESPLAPGKPYPDARSMNPFVIPGIKKLNIESNLNPNYTFRNYVEGDCNKLARSAGFNIAKKPGKTPFNPLVIHGGVGLGKTHLAHAIGNEIDSKHPGHNVLYLNAEQFTTQIVKAIRQDAMSDFIHYYNNIDTLILDDIQFLAGRKKSLEILFNVFNQFHQKGKQIILTSDRQPKDLKDIEDRLISRFKWGLIADLQTPDFETRMAILEEKLSNEDFEVPFEVMEYICYNVKENIRELEGLATSLVAQATLNDREIDLDLAKEVTEKFVTISFNKISVDYIKNLVAEHFNVKPEILETKTRKREVVIARQVSMYLARNFTNKSFENIGSKFGGKDHSTVVYSVNSVQNQMDIDEDFKNKVQRIEKEIELSVRS